MSKAKPEQFHGTCTIDQKREWERAAAKAQRSLADWMRITLDNAAKLAMDEGSEHSPQNRGK